MSMFVNRERELQLIEASLALRQNKERLLHTPILEFYGIRGIRKTLLLEKIQERCVLASVPCIRVDLAHQKESILQDLPDQVRAYLLQTEPQADPSAGGLTRALLSQGPVVLLFDAVDEASDKQLQEIEEFLCSIMNDENLLVVLASKTLTDFKHQRSIVRKLQWFSLDALDQNSCEAYLDRWEEQHRPAGTQIEREVRELIIAWTRGYPLALAVMMQAIHQQLDHRTEAGKQAIVDLLQKRVIEQEILQGLEGEWKDTCFTILRLLSVPRRSNLIIMEELIKHFAPALSLARQSSLAYFSLPHELHEATHIFSWNLEKAGFAVQAPARNSSFCSTSLPNPRNISRCMHSWPHSISSLPVRPQTRNEHATHVSTSIIWLTPHVLHGRVSRSVRQWRFICTRSQHSSSPFLQPSPGISSYTRP